EIETMTSSLRTDNACRFPHRVSSADPLTCDDAGCLTSCHQAFVSLSCHFFRTRRTPRGSTTFRPASAPSLEEGRWLDGHWLLLQYDSRTTPRATRVTTLSAS